jgi:hypothetical protein
MLREHYGMILFSFQLRRMTNRLQDKIPKNILGHQVTYAKPVFFRRFRISISYGTGFPELLPSQFF